MEHLSKRKIKWASGDLISLIDEKKRKTTFFIEIKAICKTGKCLNSVSCCDLNDNCLPHVSFAKHSNPYSRLRVHQDGSVSFTTDSEPSQNKGCVLCLEYVPDSAFCILYRIFVKVGSKILYLYLSECFDWKTSMNPDHCSFMITKLKPDSENIINTDLLKLWQLQRFLLEGYLHIPNVISNIATESLLKRLNRALGTPGMIINGGNQIGIGKFDGSETNSKELRNLLFAINHDTGLSCLDYIEFLFGGRGSCDISNSGLCGQIAFRYPELNENAMRSIDGSSWHTDGLRQGHEHGFSLLLGICLSDVTSEFQGNLLVWPGSHALLHKCKVGIHGGFDNCKINEMIRDDSCLKPHNSVIEKSNENNGISSIEDSSGSIAFHENEPLLPDLGPPLQMLGKRGDIILLHPDTAHAGGPNFSCGIRKMVYFRLRIACQCICEATGGSSGSLEEGRKCSGDCVTQFSKWEEVVEAARADMWIDLPGIKRCIHRTKLVIRDFEEFH